MVASGAAEALAFDHAEIARGDDMKVLVLAVVLAAALVATGAGQARAEDQIDIVARKFGEAMAIGQDCPTLKVSTTRMTVYTMALGYTLDDDLKARIAINFGKSLATLEGKSQNDICLVGKALYGEKGTNAPGLLVAE